MTSKILFTAGAGYIGSHTVLALLQAGHEVVVVDNLCNSSKESLNRVAKIAGREALFIQGDVRDRNFLDQVFGQHKISAVLHFAGLKAVGESVAQPLRYYENNVHGSQVLLQAMANAGVFNIVFSSSATVYGDPAVVPIDESCALGPTNPYGRTKLMVEDMLRDLAIADARWRIAILRYFNPVGAHESGLIGEDPNGIPNNFCPLSRRWRWASCPSYRYLAMTMPRPMAPAFATTFMWWIWHKAICKRLRHLTLALVRMCGT